MLTVYLCLKAPFIAWMRSVSHFWDVECNPDGRFYQRTNFRGVGGFPATHKLRIFA